MDREINFKLIAIKQTVYQISIVSFVLNLVSIHHLVVSDNYDRMVEKHNNHADLIQVFDRSADLENVVKRVSIKVYHYDSNLVSHSGMENAISVLMEVVNSAVSVRKISLRIAVCEGIVDVNAKDLNKVRKIAVEKEETLASIINLIIGDDKHEIYKLVELIKQVDYETSHNVKVAEIVISYYQIINYGEVTPLIYIRMAISVHDMDKHDYVVAIFKLVKLHAIHLLVVTDIMQKS